MDEFGLVMGGSPSFNEVLKERGLTLPQSTIFRCVVCKRKVSVDIGTARVKEATQFPVACMGCVLSAKDIPIPAELAEHLAKDAEN